MKCEKQSEDRWKKKKTAHKSQTPKMQRKKTKKKVCGKRGESESKLECVLYIPVREVSNSSLKMSEREGKKRKGSL